MVIWWFILFQHIRTTNKKHQREVRMDSLFIRGFFQKPYGPPSTPQDISQEASQETPQKVLIFFHGYGGSGYDFQPIAKLWAPHLPGVAFIAPHGAPSIHQDGYQWADLGQFDPSCVQERARYFWEEKNKMFQATLPPIDALLTKWCLTWNDVVLVGFSQGGYMALQGAFYHREVAAGICYGGFWEPHPENAPRYKPRLLCVHGAQDKVIPLFLYESTCLQIKKYGVLSSCVFSDLAHGIHKKALDRGLSFLRSTVWPPRK